MNKRTLACLLFAVWSLTTVGLVYGQEATSFRLEGTVEQATGEAVAGLTVTAINQRVPTGWLTASEFTTRDYDPNNPRSKPEDKGTYTIVYLDPFSGNVTRVGDTIKITVTEEGKAVGGATHVVTATDIEANGVTVNIILGGLQIDLNPKTLAADGSSTSSITVKIYSEDGAPVTDDTPTITSAKGATISEIVNKGAGSYTATYTTPALVDITEATTDTLTVMSMTLNESAMASLTLNVPPTVVTVAVSPSAEFSSVSSDTGAVSVTVMRAGMPITGETISFELTRGDGGTDLGSTTDAVDVGLDGVYESTYTPSKMVGEIKLVATAEKAGVSSGPVMITINAGPPAKITLMADLMTLSSGQTARITVMVMDASGNGVGGLEDDLDVSTSGSGTVGMVEKGSKFGEYTVTYTAPVVDEAGMEGITVSIPNSDVSGTIMLDLTPVPPREVSILVITGTVLKKNSEVPASGVTVSVMVNGVSVPTDVDMTGDDGAYTATRVIPGGVAARTGDRVVIVVTDSTGERGSVDFALTNEQLGEGTSATITQDIETDIKVPPREVSILVITGTVFKKDSKVPASGVTVSVTVNGVSIPTGVDMTGDDGAYTATRVIPGGVAARTGDRVVIVVTDSTGERGSVDFALTNEQLGEGDSTTITQNVETDIKLSTTTLVVLGKVLLEDGESPVPAGMVVTIANLTRGRTQTGVTEEDGCYQVTFVGLGKVVAETDDELMVTVEDASGTTYKRPMPYTLTGDDVNAGQAEIDIITDFKADPTTVMVVEGTVTNPDGSRAEAGLVVTITIGERDPGNTTTNADGAYSYRHTFVKPRSSAAKPGDVVRVEVLREATGEEGIKETDPLLSKDILNRYVQVDVQFPAAIIEITPPMPVSLDSDGNGMVDIMATITDAAGTIVIGLSITAEVDGMGSVTSPAMDNGEGMYTVTYTAAPKMIGENLATVTLMAADEPGTPMDNVMVSVVDERKPIAKATADLSLVGPGDAAAQTRQVFRNIGGVLESAGAGFNNVVEFTTYVVGRDSVQGFIDGRNQVFPDIFPSGDYPPNTLLVVDGLVRDEFLVEIKAVAAVA
jgi:enamine deaminase RidA (YjgF/YER057c/UK114 family)